jgi:hypothetical protein
MEQGIRNPGLNELMQEYSILSGRDAAEVRAYDIIAAALAEVLAPGEGVVAYADRDLNANQFDALAYQAQGAEGVPDVMGYKAGGPLNETDAFAYDQEAGRAEPDVMGYQAGGPKNETDAFAYDGAPQNPDNDAFISGREAKPADVDFLVLTEGRLIRGLLDGGDLAIAEAVYDQPEVKVLAKTYVAVRMPEAVCGLADGEWWCWPVADGGETESTVKRWERGV